MAVHKITVQVVVLVEADDLASAVIKLDNMSLADIEYETSEGDMIGSGPEIAASETVPPEKVREELLAIGNDGEFFGIEEEEDWHGALPRR